MKHFTFEEDFSSDVGVCVKDTQHQVIYQNEVCISACGKKDQNPCTEGCVGAFSNSTTFPGINEGAHLLQIKKKYDESYDAVVLNNGERVVTLLVPLKNKIEQGEKFAREYGLSKREMEILSLLLTGRMKNTEIAAKLFISAATLRTHLNNLYKKLPPESVSELKLRSRA